MKQTNIITLCILCPLVCLLLLSGCVTGMQVGVGGNYGAGRAGLGGYGGSLALMNTKRDYLNNGPTEAYTNNQAGIKLLNQGKYDQARDTFAATLKKYPGQPDATYYMGITLIYLDQREQGFKLLKSYREPLYYRATSAVQRQAAFLEKRPEVTAEKIHWSMNKERVEGFARDLEERRDFLSDR